jgi:hypothetical protein
VKGKKKVFFFFFFLRILHVIDNVIDGLFLSISSLFFLLTAGDLGVRISGQARVQNCVGHLVAQLTDEAR